MGNYMAREVLMKILHVRLAKYCDCKGGAVFHQTQGENKNCNMEN